MPNTNTPTIFRKAYEGIWNNASPEKRAQLVASGKFTADGQAIHQSALKDLGRTVGKAVKTAAPIAALAIPGLGPIAAAGLAAGGSAAGDVLQGHRLNVGGSLAAGAAGYAGNKMLHGNGVKSLIGGSGAAATDAASAAAGGGASKGFLGKLGDWVSGHPLDAAQAGLAIYGTVQGAQRAGQADQLRRRALSSVDPNAPLTSGLPANDAFDPYSAQTPYQQRPARRAALASLGY